MWMWTWTCNLYLWGNIFLPVHQTKYSQHSKFWLPLQQYHYGNQQNNHQVWTNYKVKIYSWLKLYWTFIERQYYVITWLSLCLFWMLTFITKIWLNLVKIWLNSYQAYALRQRYKTGRDGTTIIFVQYISLLRDSFIVLCAATARRTTAGKHNHKNICRSNF